MFSPGDGLVLFVSMAPKSVGHYYRVVNHAEALVALGFDVNITSPDQVVPILKSGKKISVLIFFRGSYNELFCYCRNWADKNAVPILLDLDDLTFDVKCFEPGQWSFWASLPAAEQEIWRNRVHSQFRALQAADGALVSTLPLAQHVRSMQRLAWVWPNGFGETSWRSFQAARCIGPLQRQRAMGDVITIGYASGTPTHSADFETVAVALGGLMRRERSIQLCLIGFLDLASYPALRGLESRITHRPLVAYDQLALEYARFDINLAPLEIHSSFCQAKSALKFFESAAVGVPTVATPTQPFKELIRNRWNGCLASSSDDWEREITWLLKRRRRIRLAHAAFFTLRMRCSPWAQRRDLRRILRQSAGR